jgi:hypothetical protein
MVRTPGPATIASARVSRATLLVGGLGLVSAVFVLTRLLASWRVAPDAAAHHVTILGQTLSYPTANAAAIVVVALAALGLMVTAMVVRETVSELFAAARLQKRLARRKPRPMRGALVIDDPRPRAFCAGLLRPRVYVSTGAVAALDDAGLDALLAHEDHHARRRDPLRLATGRVLARSLFLMPGLGELIERQQSLAELSADENAVRAAPANRSGLASAMLSLSETDVPGHSVGIDPARVDFLLGEAPSWRFPFALCVGSVAILGLLLAVAVLAGRVAHGSATLAPPFLSGQPCVVALAAITALGLLATVYAGRRAPTLSRRLSSAPLTPRSQASTSGRPR